jgi:pimeloyl-ACP methyl ester carboxylesterase
LSFQLHSAAVTGRDPVHWLVVTHGILGSGTNLRTLSKKLVAARPEWGVLLVDLPGHGLSRPSPPPHTIEAAAEQVTALVRDQRQRGRQVRGLLGHSLGGKVMLLARQQLPGLRQTWVLDSSPSPSDGDEPQEVPGVLAMLESLPDRFDDRRQFVEAVEARGFSTTLAMWLAMSLDRDPNGVRFGLDLAVMRQFFASYYQTNAWPNLLSETGGAVEMVVGTRSESLDSTDRDRLRALAEQHPHVRLHEIDSGHWVHVERPDWLAELVAKLLPSEV